MKNFKLLIASMVLTCFAMFPVASLADEDLDVTMDVIDNLSQVEGVILEMSAAKGDDEGGHDGDAGGHDYEGEEGGDDHDGEEGDHDYEGEEGFEYDDEGESDDGMDSDDDGHDEGDDVDTDEYDEDEHGGDDMGGDAAGDGDGDAGTDG